ncbi:hypothetical protein HK102_008781 [Quaeritorhiza haematococci]|nr:hypothetical protein HK102_008781 [Quaeritorhiza haematococci]
MNVESIEEHYQSELRRLKEDDLEEGTRRKRGAAVTARQQISSTQGKGKLPALRALDEHEQVLCRIKANRLKRSANMTKVEKPVRKRGRPADVPDENPTCFMCGEPLPSDSDEVNRHIDACLMAQQQRQQETRDEESSRSASPTGSDNDFNEPTSNSTIFGGFEEYTWAGQKRIRATALLEGGYAASGFAVHKKDDPDVDEDIDIDDDETEEFGPKQYPSFEADLHRFLQVDDAILLESDERPHRDELPQSPENALSDDDEDEKIDIETVQPSDEIILPDLRTLPADSQLIIEALRNKIKELEKTRKAPSTCLICLEPYNKPVVAITCWHVHCEKHVESKGRILIFLTDPEAKTSVKTAEKGPISSVAVPSSGENMERRVLRSRTKVNLPASRSTKPEGNKPEKKLSSGKTPSVGPEIPNETETLVRRSKRRKEASPPVCVGKENVFDDSHHSTLGKLHETRKRGTQKETDNRKSLILRNLKSNENFNALPNSISDSPGSEKAPNKQSTALSCSTKSPLKLHRRQLNPRWSQVPLSRVQSPCLSPIGQSAVGEQSRGVGFCSPLDITLRDSRLNVELSPLSSVRVEKSPDPGKEAIYGSRSKLGEDSPTHSPLAAFRNTPSPPISPLDDPFGFVQAAKQIESKVKVATRTKRDVRKAPAVDGSSEKVNEIESSPSSSSSSDLIAAGSYDAHQDDETSPPKSAIADDNRGLRTRRKTTACTSDNDGDATPKWDKRRKMISHRAKKQAATITSKRGSKSRQPSGNDVNHDVMPKDSKLGRRHYSDLDDFELVEELVL